MSASIISLSVDQAAGTTAQLVAAVSGKRIEVVGYNLAVVGGVATVKSLLRDLTANTVRMTLVGEATNPVVYQWNGGREVPAFTTALDEGLELVTGTAVTITGHINYRLIH